MSLVPASTTIGTLAPIVVVGVAPAAVRISVLVGVAERSVMPLTVAPVIVGLVANTAAPVPVSSVRAPLKLAEDGVARNVATLVPSPDIPVETGKPVILVAVPLDGVPRTPFWRTIAPVDPVLTPRAVTTPDPVVVEAGAEPAPPPMTRAPEARAAEVAQVLLPLK